MMKIGTSVHITSVMIVSAAASISNKKSTRLSRALQWHTPVVIYRTIISTFGP